MAQNSYVFGKVYTVTITEEALKKSPAWKSDENPPLSAKKAINLAAAMKDTLVKDSDDHAWGLESASLKPFLDKWYWQISYETRVMARGIGGSGSSGPPTLLHLVVLMDGTVVKPEVRIDRNPR